MTTKDALYFYYCRAFKTIFLCFTVCKVDPATIVTFVHDSISCFRKKSPSDKLCDERSSFSQEKLEN